MKIRHGFVSNSSSTSFTAILSQDAYNKMLLGMTEFEKAAIEYLCPTKKEAFGTSLLIYTWGTGEDYSPMHFSPSEKKYLLSLIPKENGCQHEYDREAAKFCPKCGKASFSEGDGSSLSCNIREIQNKIYDVADESGIAFKEYH